MNKVSIGELEKLEHEMTPGELHEDARGICGARNALSVLLGIAKAAGQYVEIHDVSQVLDDEHHKRLYAAMDNLRAALSMVTP